MKTKELTMKENSPVFFIRNVRLLTTNILPIPKQVITNLNIERYCKYYEDIRERKFSALKWCFYNDTRIKTKIFIGKEEDLESWYKITLVCNYFQSWYLIQDRLQQNFLTTFCCYSVIYNAQLFLILISNECLTHHRLVLLLFGKNTSYSDYHNHHFTLTKPIQFCLFLLFNNF